MLNHITVMGRLTRDPELRRTSTGRAVCSFRVAVDRDFQPRDGGEKQTDFIDCVAWEQRGEFVSKWFSKGKMIVVDGRLQSRRWQDKTGQDRISWEIQANNVYFGEGRRDSEYNSGSSYGSGYGASQGYGGNASPGYGGSSPGYSAPAESAAAPSSAPGYGDFSEIGDEDGDLPF